MAHARLFKCTIIGDSLVGKSSLMLQFTERQFIPEHELTIGVNFGTRMIPVGKDLVKMQIWDTAGSETFKSITRSYYRGSIGALLVYDISKRETFANLFIWLKELRKYGDEDVIIMVVGNKKDLEARREVSAEEGKQFAREHGMMFIEVSARSYDTVNTMFTKLAETMLEKRCSYEPKAVDDQYLLQLDRDIIIKKDRVSWCCR